MTHNSIASQTQADIRVTGQIDAFFNRFRIGTLLHRCGIRKRHGHSVRSLTQAIFTLPFLGQNFYRGIVVNPDQPFGYVAMDVALNTLGIGKNKSLSLCSAPQISGFEAI